MANNSKNQVRNPHELMMEQLVQ